MLCIKNNSKNPYFNLAAEEYLLKHKDEDIFMLWQNKDTVVVGKHQNIYAEINLDFVRENNINLARRLSGGGTVYHDLGNINFTYIMTGKYGKMVDFAKYTDDIVQALHSMNIPASRNKRNDLIIDNKKISGNAEHVFKNRVLHHGTLLFNSELDVLNKAIKAPETKYTDKAVQSVRSKVCNISKFADNETDIMGFYNKIFNFILGKYTNAKLYTFTQNDIEQIKKLEKEKYSTWDWVFGYSPKYELTKTISKNNKSLDIYLRIKRGIIEYTQIKGDMLNSGEIIELSKFLTNKKHDKDNLLNSYKNNNTNINNNFITIINSIF